MKKFNFRLEKIKRYKEQLEQEKKLKLAAERQNLFKEQNTLTDIVKVQDRYWTQYSERKLGKINVNQLIVTRRYLDKLAKDVSVQTKKVKRAENKVTKAQDAYIQASKEKKKYEKLKEKHLELYTKESQRLENIELDEFGSRRKLAEASIS